MIGRLLRSSGALIVYFCVGTVMAQAVLAGYVASAWELNRDKLIQILAIARGIDLFAIHDDDTAGTNAGSRRVDSAIR